MLEKKDQNESASTNPGAVPQGEEPKANGSTEPAATPRGEGTGAADAGAAPRGEQAADAGAPPRPKEPKEPKEPKQPKEPKAKEGNGKKPKGQPGHEAPAEPAGPPPEPAPRPRLLDYYEQRVRGKLAQQFGFKNPHEVPRLLKIVLNVGMGDAPKNPKGLETAVAELAAICGQHPVVTRAKKA